MHTFGSGLCDTSLKAIIWIKQLCCNEGILYICFWPKAALLICAVIETCANTFTTVGLVASAHWKHAFCQRQWLAVWPMVLCSRCLGIVRGWDGGRDAYYLHYQVVSLCQKKKETAVFVVSCLKPLKTTGGWWGRSELSLKTQFRHTFRIALPE